METIEIGQDHIFKVYVRLSGQGVTGQTVLATLQRSSDNKYWNGVDSWIVLPTNLACVETGSIYPGEYTYLLISEQIEDSVKYKIQFKITSGVYAFEQVQEVIAKDDTLTQIKEAVLSLNDFNPATDEVDGVTYDYIMQLCAAMVNGNFSYNASNKQLTFYKRDDSTILTVVEIPNDFTRTRIS